jgi:predicted PurR-regulated permease PerM
LKPIDELVNSAMPGSPAPLAPGAPDPARSKARVPRGLEHAAQLAWRLLVTAAAIALVGFVAYRLRTIVVAAAAALLLTSVLAPAAGWLRAHRWPPLLATWAVLLAAAGLAAVVASTVLPQVVGYMGQVGTQLQAAARELQHWLVEGPLHVPPDQLDRYLGMLRDGIGANASTLALRVLSVASLALEVVVGGLLALVLTFFFLKDGDDISSWGLALVPQDRRELAARMGRRAFATIGSYVRGSALLGLAEGTAIGIGLTVIGVPLAVPLAILAFLGAFLPLVGSLASGTIAALVALVNGGPVDALLVGVLVAAVNQADAHVLQPLVMGRVLRLHPLAIVLALAVGAAVAGLLGAFLAVPFTAVAAAMVNEVRSPVPALGGRGGGGSSLPEGGNHRAPDQGGDHRQRRPDRDVVEVGEEHLDSHEHEHGGEADLEVGEASDRASEQEVQRS